MCVGVFALRRFHDLGNASRSETEPQHKGPRPGPDRRLRCTFSATVPSTIDSRARADHGTSLVGAPADHGNLRATDASKKQEERSAATSPLAVFRFGHRPSETSEILRRACVRARCARWRSLMRRMQSDAFPSEGDDGGIITPSKPHQARSGPRYSTPWRRSRDHRDHRASGTAVLAPRRDEPDEPAETSQNHEEMVHF